MQIVANLGVSDIDQRLEELLIDGILYAFQEQTSSNTQVRTSLSLLSACLCQVFSHETTLFLLVAVSLVVADVDCVLFR